MKILINPNKNEWSEILKRPTQTLENIEATVSEVFNDVQRRGDQAISKYTELFDGVPLNNTEVTSEDIEKASKLVSTDLKNAIQTAKSNIEKFHAAQKTERVSVQTSIGIECWQEKRPHTKSRFIYSWWNCTIIFYCFNASYSSPNRRL